MQLYFKIVKTASDSSSIVCRYMELDGGGVVILAESRNLNWSEWSK